jgi:hypothetical protein
MESFSDLEQWDKPEFQYGMRPIDKKNPNGPKEHGVTGVKDFKKQFDLPFNKKILRHYTRCDPPKNWLLYL